MVLFGKPTPWHGYADHEMGQPPCLLSLPAFEVPLSSNMDGGAAVRSKDFSLFLSQQQDRLLENSKIEHVPSLVRAIAKQGRKGNSRFRIELTNGDIFHADYIDFCMGPGPARVPAISAIDEDSRSIYKTWVRSVWDRDESPLTSLLSAEQFLNLSPAPWPSHSRIAVWGGGGVALLSIDQLLKANYRVDWLEPRGNVDLTGAVPTELCERLTNSPRLINRTGSPVGTVRVLENKIDVIGIDFDGMVVAMGPYGSRDEVFDDQLKPLLPEWLFPLDIVKQQDIFDPIECELPGFFVGTQSPDKRLRFFGPSTTKLMIAGALNGRVGSSVSGSLAYERDYLKTLWSGLPRFGLAPSFDPPGGPKELLPADHRLIPVQAAGIALANRFQPHLDRILNVNTAPREELARHLDGDDVNRVIEARVDAPIVGGVDPQIGCWYGQGVESHSVVSPTTMKPGAISTD